MGQMLSNTESEAFDALVAEYERDRRGAGTAASALVACVALVGMIVFLAHTAVAFGFFVALAFAVGRLVNTVGDRPSPRSRIELRLQRLVVRGSSDVAGHVWPASYIEDAE